MPLPYSTVSNYTSSLNTGSYLNSTDHLLFVDGYSQEFWYGFSEMDVIELSAHDLDGNLIGWDTINQEKHFEKITLSYLDKLDNIVTYSFNQLVNDLILYKNKKILVNPIENLSSSFGITEGSYIVSYNFTREMAGSPLKKLIVKEISPSRTEIKLTPVSSSNLRYESFCYKKFQIKDVAPLVLQLVKQCPYDQIYNKVKDEFEDDINFIKSIFVLPGDGNFVTFLRNLYEDVILYNKPLDSSNSPEKISRDQGIRTYFTNFILSNYESISDFQSIRNQFISFVSDAVERKFKRLGNQTSHQYISAKKFLKDFFTEHFYDIDR